MKTILKTALLSATALSLVVALPAMPAYAQTSDDTLEDDDIIIVTARKKEESLQDTPIAISAFGAEDIEEQGLEDILDIAATTPGLNIQSFNSGPSPVRYNLSPRFRGVSINDAGRPLNRTGIVLIDGIVVTGGIQGLGVSELERVEVIKGPQSAVFGRNSFSGAINYITKDPSDFFAVSGRALVASRNEYRFSLSVEGPIAGDVLGARVTASYDHNGGHYDNSAVEGQKLGTEATWSIGGKLVFRPADTFTVKFRANYYQDNDGPAAVGLSWGVGEHNFGGFPITTNSDGSTTADRSAAFTAPNTRDSTRTETTYRGVVNGILRNNGSIGLNTGQASFDAIQTREEAGSDYSLEDFGVTLAELDGFGLRRENFRIGSSVEWEISDSVGMDALFGYSNEKILYVSDADFTSQDVWVTATAVDLEDFSFESRFFGDAIDDRLSWSLGFNYYDATYSNDGGFVRGSMNPLARFGIPAVFNGFDTDEARTVGIFATLEYDITEQLTASFEGRYQWDRIRDLPSNEATFKNFLPRVVLSYEPTDDTLVYFNFGIGNLPGGFNSGFAGLSEANQALVLQQVPQAAATFDEERLYNYEIGWKQTALDGKLSFNLAAFLMQRNDQVTRNIAVIPDDMGNPETFNIDANVASTRIYGVEIDWVIQPSDQFQFQGTFAYISSKVNGLPSTGTLRDFGDIYGNDLSGIGQVAPAYPPLTFSFGATYTQPLNMGMFDSMYIRGDGVYTSGYYKSFANLAELGDRFNANLRVGLQGDNMRLEFFITNLFNEQTPTSLVDWADISLATGGFGFTREAGLVSLAPRRQFGGRISFDF